MEILLETECEKQSGIINLEPIKINHFALVPIPTNSSRNPMKISIWYNDYHQLNISKTFSSRSIALTYIQSLCKNGIIRKSMWEV